MTRILANSLKLILVILMKQNKKNKKIPFCPVNKNSPQDKFSVCMNDMKRVTYAQNGKLICDWTAKMNSLVRYRMLKL